jgi:hypothetical protein
MVCLDSFSQPLYGHELARDSIDAREKKKKISVIMNYTAINGCFTCNSRENKKIQGHPNMIFGGEHGCTGNVIRQWSVLR